MSVGHPLIKSSFQLHMASACLVLLAVSIIGCRLTNIHVNLHHHEDGFFMDFIMLAVLALYWNQENRPPLLDSILVLPWILLLIPLIIFPMLIAAHLHMPLQDSRLAHIDHLFRVSVPGIAAWAHHNWLGRLISDTYPLLIIDLVLASLLPSLTGKVTHAREFVIANVVAISIGLPLFWLVPAVGPWYGHAYGSHLLPNPTQLYCQTQFFAMRTPGAYIFSTPAGVICFPSFHVIWAILSVAALWGFRPIRVPSILLACMIILSTMTTGWHYFTDVIAGALIALLAILCAKLYTRYCSPVRQTSPSNIEYSEEVAS